MYILSTESYTTKTSRGICKLIYTSPILHADHTNTLIYAQKEPYTHLHYIIAHIVSNLEVGRVQLYGVCPGEVTYVVDISIKMLEKHLYRIITLYNTHINVSILMLRVVYTVIITISNISYTYTV